MMAGDVVKFIDYAPSHFENGIRNFRCGRSLFSDDIWDFKGFIPDSENWNDAKCRLDFSVFNQPRIRETVKWYICSELLGVTFNSVKRKLASFSTLRKYLKDNPEISSFNDFTKHKLQDFFNYILADTKDNGEPTSAITQKKAGQAIQELLNRGAVKGWDVPTNANHVPLMYDSLIINNKRIKEGTKFGVIRKVLPEEQVVSNLIETAKKALDGEDDILTPASIIISSQTGRRINELLTIKTGCLQMFDGEMHLVYKTGKTKKETIEVRKPANELVCLAIKKLEEYSRPLREESGLPYLFLGRNRNLKGHPVQIASLSNWNKNRLRPWIMKHNIRDSNGSLVDLTSHYFRAICATYARKGGMKTHDVAELLDHSSILMTETYDHSDKEQIVKEILSGETPIASTNRIVMGSLEGNENPFRGKTVEQIEKLRRALKIELLPHGICMHHPMRGEPCEQDGACLGCGNFLASSRHLPVYEKRLKKVNEELQNANNDGIWKSKLHFQQGKLEFYIKEINKKINDENFQQVMSEVVASKYEK